MGRTKLALAVLALTVLTLACNLPTSLDELTGWSNAFTVDPNGALSESIRNVANVLVVAAALLTSFGLVYNMATGRTLTGGMYFSGLLLLTTSGFLKFYIPLATQLGDAARGSITIDQVIDTYGWSLSLNPLKLALEAIAVGQTIALPTLSAMYEMFMTLILIVVLFASIFAGSATAAVWAIAQLMGWLLFLVLYRLLIVMSGIVTSIPFADSVTEPTMNGIYILAVAILMIACYWLLPIWSTRRFAPKLQVVLTGQQVVKVEAEATPSQGNPHKIRRNSSQNARDLQGAAERAAKIEAGIGGNGDDHKIRRRKT